MIKIGRNDPCPCGSGKKFKKCHMGREEELVLNRLEHLPPEAGEQIVALPEVDYGPTREILDRLDFPKLTRTVVGVKCIDLASYLALGYVAREAPENLDRISAGQMVNPYKTMQADPNHIYLAISPGISGSTLLHQLAHALDYLAGSRINPALARPLSMELELPSELIEHPQEFGYWFQFLVNEFGVEPDAEDAIVVYLYEKGYLLPGAVIKGENFEVLQATVKRTLEFIKDHRDEIDEHIRTRPGYRENR